MAVTVGVVPMDFCRVVMGFEYHKLMVFMALKLSIAISLQTGFMKKNADILALLIWDFSLPVNGCCRIGIMLGFSLKEIFSYEVWVGFHSSARDLVVVSAKFYFLLPSLLSLCIPGSVVWSLFVWTSTTWLVLGLSVHFLLQSFKVGGTLT